MASRAAYPTPESDSEIFFASVCGAALVLCLNEILCTLVLRSGSGTLGPSLLYRAAPVTSVRLLYTLFVLLPAFVSFASIGLPFFLRTLRAALKGRLSKRSMRGLLLLAVCIALVSIELHFGRNGLIGASMISLVGLVCGFRTIAEVGRAYGYRLLGAAGIALAGLAWFESRILAGAAPEIALAPTALVAAGFFAASGLLTVTSDVMRPGRESRLRVALCWFAALAWLGAPLVRSPSGNNPLLADRIELAALVAAAVILTGASLLRRAAHKFHS